MATAGLRSLACGFGLYQSVARSAYCYQVEIEEGIFALNVEAIAYGIFGCALLLAIGLQVRWLWLAWLCLFLYYINYIMKLDATVVKEMHEDIFIYCIEAVFLLTVFALAWKCLHSPLFDYHINSSLRTFCCYLGISLAFDLTAYLLVLVIWEMFNDPITGGLFTQYIQPIIVSCAHSVVFVVCYVFGAFFFQRTASFRSACIQAIFFGALRLIIMLAIHHAADPRNRMMVTNGPPSLYLFLFILYFPFSWINYGGRRSSPKNPPGTTPSK